MIHVQRLEIHRVIAIDLMADARRRGVVKGAGVRGHASRDAEAEDSEYKESDEAYRYVFHCFFFLFWVVRIAAMCFRVTFFLPQRYWNVNRVFHLPL